MPKTIFVVNKDNWTGGQVTVEIDVEKKTFELYGDRFHLNQIHDDPVSYEIIGKGWKDPLGSVYEDRKDEWIALGNSEISREGNTAFEAAIKLLCNLL